MLLLDPMSTCKVFRCWTPAREEGARRRCSSSTLGDSRGNGRKDAPPGKAVPCGPAVGEFGRRQERQCVEAAKCGWSAPSPILPF